MTISSVKKAIVYDKNCPVCHKHLKNDAEHSAIHNKERKHK